jgi:hypothetical protein
VKKGVTSAVSPESINLTAQSGVAYTVVAAVVKLTRNRWYFPNPDFSRAFSWGSNIMHSS